jgi:hypothetical protein
MTEADRWRRMPALVTIAIWFAGISSAAALTYALKLRDGWSRAFGIASDVEKSDEHDPQPVRA